MNYRRRDSGLILGGPLLTLGSEAQEMVRSLWENGGKWSLGSRVRCWLTCLEVGVRALKARAWLGWLMSRVPCRGIYF